MRHNFGKVGIRLVREFALGLLAPMPRILEMVARDGIEPPTRGFSAWPEV